MLASCSLVLGAIDDYHSVRDEWLLYPDTTSLAFP